MRSPPCYPSLPQPPMMKQFLLFFFLHLWLGAPAQLPPTPVTPLDKPCICPVLQTAFHARIAFCMDLHNEAVKAMRFEPDAHRWGATRRCRSSSPSSLPSPSA